MNRHDKEEAVEDLKSAISRAKGVYLADFQGMTVARSTELRSRCRRAGVRFSVVKNTLARRAFAGQVQGDIDSFLVGPTAIALSERDEITAAKILADFLKEFERPVFKAGVVDGKVLGPDQVKVLASLPGKDVLLGMLVSGLKSPVQMLHSALSSPLRNLGSVLKQVAEAKA